MGAHMEMSMGFPILLLKMIFGPAFLQLVMKEGFFAQVVSVNDYMMLE